tara:strand:- start:498 stop:1034 length:537 start_codon:yes stop_codon:yes gene_type:complete
MALTLISTHTASASATLDITSGITSTYDSYEFHCVNMHPAAQPSNFSFQVNAAGASGFNETITSTSWRAILREDNTDATLSYQTARDQAQGTAYQVMTAGQGTDADQSASGILTLYAPSSTTYVKHFTARTQFSHQSDYSIQSFTAGYVNVTAAIDEISFKFDTGNIDAGTIKMFGVS